MAGPSPRRRGLRPRKAKRHLIQLVDETPHQPPPPVGDDKAILMRRRNIDEPSAYALLRAITDRIRIVQGGAPVHYPDFMFQYREAANFPGAVRQRALLADDALGRHALVRAGGGGFG